MATYPPMMLTVKSREKTLFEGEVTSITSYNEKGKFDVLPLHSNFISLIGEKIIIQPTVGPTQEIQLDNAVLRVIENTIQIFIGIER